HLVISVGGALAARCHQSPLGVPEIARITGCHLVARSRCAYHHGVEIPVVLAGAHDEDTIVAGSEDGDRTLAPRIFDALTQRGSEEGRCNPDASEAEVHDLGPLV